MSQFTKITSKQSYEMLLATMLLFFCVVPNLIPIFILMLILFTGYHVAKKKMTFHFSILHLAFVLFFLAYVIGTFYTNHPKEASGNLERRMLYVIFPLLFSFQFAEKIRMNFLAVGLIVGLIIVSCLGMVHSYSNYLAHGDFNNSFGSTTFSYIHHPTYFSAMILTSLVLFKEGVKRKWRYFTTLTFLLYLLFSAVMLLFSFSFAGILFFFFLLMFWFFEFVYQKSSKWVFALSLIALPLAPVLLYFSNIHIQIELDSAKASITSLLKNPSALLQPSAEPISGNKVRMIMWLVSTEEIKAHPFGAGTSNFDDALGSRLDKYGLHELAVVQYNPHNQFLSIGVELGVLGLLVFLFLLYQAFKIAWKQDNAVFFFVLLILVFNMLFESMLQRQSGIVFYTFFICILPLVDTRSKREVKPYNPSNS
ncbi:MAG: O-antigen ligase family protein [Crocinitomicaceae bacterium]